MNENEELVDMIKAICNITKMNIYIYPKGELTFCVEY